MIRACSICISPEKSEIVNTLLAAGRRPNYIEGQMRERGFPVKQETITKHERGCLKAKPESEDALVRRAAGKTTTKGDFATLVQQEAMRLLESGELRIRTVDGLQAQALLDRRAEKAADRDLMLNLARLMTLNRPPAEIIEGDYVDLAPLALVAGD